MERRKGRWRGGEERGVESIGSRERERRGGKEGR